MHSGLSTSYRFGRIEVNPTTRQVIADGQPLSLGARAFDVLLALIERRERLVTKDELLELVWPGMVVEENNLQVQISTLRKLLGSEAIATIAGRGYQFTSAVQETGATDPKSIAVLPFTNMSDDKANAYFADGLQEDLLTQLAMLGELKVVSRTSVAEYRDTRKNVRQIGTELAVASLVEGSVRRAGDRVRVTAQLIDARSDKHLWGNSYDRELKDIFAIQSEIANEIARALKVTLSPLEQARLNRRPTENLLAYELFLRNQELLARAGTWRGLYLGERIRLVTRAVELDPAFALAWARLASECAYMYFEEQEDETLLARAKHAINQALALAPQDADIRSEAGNFHYYAECDYARAAQYFEDLLRLAPNHVETLLKLSFVRRRQGRWLDANALLERALAIDGRHVSALEELRHNFIRFRHFDEALAVQRRIAELRPSDSDARCYLHTLEYLKTGSFAAYDAWRAVQPAGLERSSYEVWTTDLWRAQAHRDFDAVLRLLDAPPTPELLDVEFPDEVRAIVLLENGQRSEACQLARSSLHKTEPEWKRLPTNYLFASRTILNRALLGERETAISDYRLLSENAYVRRKMLWGESHLSELEIYMYALLGDREQALRALAAQLTRPGISPKHWRCDIFAISLWGDPAFETLMNDPANNAPLPITNDASAASAA